MELFGVALLPPSGARSDRKLLDNPETQILSMIPAPLVSILMDSARVSGCCSSNYVAYFSVIILARQLRIGAENVCGVPIPAEILGFKRSSRSARAH